MKSEEDMTELIKMYDKMGDVCHSLQAHQAAILYYQQEVGRACCTNFILVLAMIC